MKLSQVEDVPAISGILFHKLDGQWNSIEGAGETELC